MKHVSTLMATMINIHLLSVLSLVARLFPRPPIWVRAVATLDHHWTLLITMVLLGNICDFHFSLENIVDSTEEIPFHRNSSLDVG